jgi:hypothetical protein
MRNKTLTSILLFFLLTSNICCAQFVDDDPELDINKKPLPPYSIRKVKTYEDFTNFEFQDLNGRIWTNRNGLERPMLILTGKWALRHDIKKWAHYLAFKYNNFCDIIWVFNPDSTEFANHRERNEKALKDIAIAVPVVIDNHAIIGRSLKIEYDIPTIIGLTRKNTLGFVFESPLNNYAKDRLEKLMFTKLYK